MTDIHQYLGCKPKLSASTHRKNRLT